MSEVIQCDQCKAVITPENPALYFPFCTVQLRGRISSEQRTADLHDHCVQPFMEKAAQERIFQAKRRETMVHA